MSGTAKVGVEGADNSGPTITMIPGLDATAVRSIHKSGEINELSTLVMRSALVLIFLQTITLIIGLSRAKEAPLTLVILCINFSLYWTMLYHAVHVAQNPDLRSLGCARPVVANRNYAIIVLILLFLHFVHQCMGGTALTTTDAVISAIMLIDNASALNNTHKLVSVMDIQVPTSPIYKSDSVAPEPEQQHVAVDP